MLNFTLVVNLGSNYVTDLVTFGFAEDVSAKIGEFQGVWLGVDQLSE